MTGTFSDKKGIHFTDSAYTVLFSIVDDPAFRERDADMIFEALMTRLDFVNFGAFLKRFIYEKVNPGKPFEELDDDYYRRVIVQSFADTGTPASFEPTTAKLGNLVKNWLTQKVVGRRVVFLLGFGLSMTGDEVDMFLKKALGTQSIRCGDPFERLCSYCYSKGYSYDRFRILYDACTAGGSIPPEFPDEDREITERMHDVKEQEATGHEKRAREIFDSLYEKASRAAARMLERQDDDGEEYGAGLIERVLLSGVPKEKTGNLTSAAKSSLASIFSYRRPNRQRFWTIKKGSASPDRFDIITLNFLLFSETGDSGAEDESKRRVRRFDDFVNSCNDLLGQCGFGNIYVVNPYECFILMCILSDNPICTYSEVFEKSYEK